MAERGHLGWLAAVGVAVVSVLAQLAIYDRAIVPLDEGQLVAIAERLRGGEVLYRDIYTGVFPGLYYVVHLLFSVFGSDLIVTRGFQVAVNAATAVCLALLTARVAPRRWALVPAGLYLGWVIVNFPVLTMPNYSPLAMLLGLGVLMCLLRYFETTRRGYGLAVGVLLAASAVTKQNFGALVFFVVVIAYVWERRGTALVRRSFVGGLMPIALGGAAVTLAAAGYFLATGALGALLDATVLSIGGKVLAAYNDPIPPIFGPHPTGDGRFVFVYTPPALFNYLIRGEPFFGQPISPLMRGMAIRLGYGGALVTLLTGPLLVWRSSRADPLPIARRTRTSVLFASVLFLGIFPTAIWSHLVYISAPIFLVLGLLGARIDAALVSGAGVAVRLWRGLCVLLLVAVAVASVRIAADIRRWNPEPLGLRGASVSVSAETAATYRRAIDFIERCSRPADPIFVAPDMPLLYFLSGRRNPTPYDLTIPGNVDGAGIVDRLTSTETRCVVFKPEMYAQLAPFEELFPELVRHLETAYQRAEVIQGGADPWYGLVRRGADPS